MRNRYSPPSFGLFAFAAAAFLMVGCHKPAAPKRAEPIAAPANPAGSASTSTSSIWRPQIPLFASGDQPQWSISAGTEAAEVKTADGIDEIYPIVASVPTVPLRILNLGIAAHGAMLRVGESACASAAATVPAAAAEATIDGRRFFGCAEPASASESGDWRDAMYTWMPAMRACLQRSQSDNSVLMGASLDGKGVLRARLRMSDGTRFDCAASSSGERILSFDSTRADEQALPDGPLLFALAAGAYANLGCVQAPATVLSQTGEVLGFMQRGLCETLNSAPLAASARQ